MKKPLVLVAIIIGILLLILSAIYILEPANSLPSFLPGHEMGLTKHHYKHAIGTFLLALAVFAFAWFQSGPKKGSSAAQQ